MTDTPRLVYLVCANADDPICLKIVSNGHEQTIPLTDRQVLNLVAQGAEFVAARKVMRSLPPPDAQDGWRYRLGETADDVAERRAEAE